MLTTKARYALYIFLAWDNGVFRFWGHLYMLILVVQKFAAKKCFKFGDSHKNETFLFFHVSGHFTQVVWKDSKHLGVGKARSSNGKIIVVANYDPPGNFIGQYKDNVLKAN